MQQEPCLFDGSIRQNITYGAEDKYTDEDIYEACRQANAHDFIQDKTMMPNGLDTIVGERGVKLSGGQKQRVAVARALIRKAKIILLDEATSALDAESEYQVQKALDILMKNGNQTIIVIAHRLSTIKDADVIVVMQKGTIMESGTHTELVNKNGFYKKLIERQLVDQVDEEPNEQIETKA